MKSPARRVRKRRGTDRDERRAFAWIVFITAIPVVLATAAIVWSTRPDLYYVVPSPAENGARSLAWRTLDDLLEASEDPMESRPDLFNTEVQIVGYMVTFENSRERGDSVTRFLLVPDVGNWLHPPHFHLDEVVDVRLKAGETAPMLDRKAVVVRGMLSVESADLKVTRVVYHLLACDVRRYR